MPLGPADRAGLVALLREMIERNRLPAQRMGMGVWFSTYKPLCGRPAPLRRGFFTALEAPRTSETMPYRQLPLKAQRLRAKAERIRIDAARFTVEEIRRQLLD